MVAYLNDFCVQRPKYEMAQQRLIDWLQEAHARSGGVDAKNLLIKAGTGDKKAQNRGTFYDDCTHRDWDQMQVYGKTMTERMHFYDRHVQEVMQKFYAHASIPEQVIHVSCTGYVAPNGAQKILAQLSPQTLVTNAYHMGCYAAIPAIRIGMGFLALGSKDVDLVHTELCSLHMGTHLHTKEQLIAETLFSDGLIKYRLSKKPVGYEILKVQEELIPNTAEHMGWTMESWGMRMKLSSEIPLTLGRAIAGFVARLSPEPGSFYAIHPGGPRIIEQIARILALKDWQVAKSFEIFEKYGNMSSATVPHIWAALQNDVQPKDQIVSLAFGPGLTIAGALLRCI